MIYEADKHKLSGYKLQKSWFSFALNNPERVTPTQAALYWFCIEHCNSLGWPRKFGLPASLAMAATGIKSYNTYIKSFRELVEFGFIELIEKSKNQYTANTIALSNFDEAIDKAIDRATDEPIDKATDEPIVVYKNNKPKTNKPVTNIINTGETEVSQRTPQELNKGDFEKVLLEGGVTIYSEEETPLEGNLEENNYPAESQEKIKRCAKKEKKVAAQFQKPTLQEVADYCRERGNFIDPEKWLDYYTANGWKVGKNPMKDWKAAVRTWERNGIETKQGNAKQPNSKIGSLIGNIEAALITNNNNTNGREQRYNGATKGQFEEKQYEDSF